MALSNLTPADLSENESIWLSRMKDSDTGIEWEMVFKGGLDARQKGIPRDQAESLVLKGLAVYLVGVDSHGQWGIILTDAGRKLWAELNKPEPSPATSQYTELTEDELIELAAMKADDYLHNPEKDVARELAEVVTALKLRHDIAAPARRRVGEYLRQTLLAADRTSALRAKGHDAKGEPEEVIDQKNADQWTGKALLRFSDLTRLVAPLVRDTKQEHLDRQQVYLEHILRHNKLSEKQELYLRAIAAGAIRSYGSYTGGHSTQKGSGFEETVGHRPDGRTLDALRRRGLIDSRMEPGWNGGYTLCLKKPE